MDIFAWQTAWQQDMPSVAAAFSYAKAGCSGLSRRNWSHRESIRQALSLARVQASWVKRQAAVQSTLCIRTQEETYADVENQHGDAIRWSNALQAEPGRLKAMEVWARPGEVQVDIEGQEGHRSSE